MADTPNVPQDPDLGDVDLDIDHPDTIPDELATSDPKAGLVWVMSK